ncbi:MAG: GH1 family beta-glucosidase [Cytophagales bacterium]|nr:GH1 family beta-glucosidase [Cytophagales bacterium]
MVQGFEINRELFGEKFKWGVALSAFQTEGHSAADGKGMNIWDKFTRKAGAIKTGETADIACNFYQTYPDDIKLVKHLNFEHFGFSVSWSRILPDGKGAVNTKGIDYYHRVTDTCLELGIEPWITMYHWDLPQKLEDKGGWANRDMLGWFADYVHIITKAYGDKVKNWKVLNEPSAFCGFGYMTGEHAPGHKNIFKFLAAAHHANLCQGIGGRVANENVKDPHIGTSFATFCVQPKNDNPIHIYATRRIDATINRMFIEPLCGLGYPYKDFPAMKMIELYFKPEDEKNIKHTFDFIGVQYYCRLVGKFAWYPLIAFAGEVPAKERKVPMNNMGFEIYPDGMYEVLKRYNEYPGVNKILVTENGVCLHDELRNGRVYDPVRIQFYTDYLKQLLKAQTQGVNVEGFFCWTLLDNFEWWEGYQARFGLVHVNHDTQERIIKDSGYWIKDFLEKSLQA